MSSYYFLGYNESGDARYSFIDFTTEAERMEKDRYFAEKVPFKLPDLSCTQCAEPTGAGAWQLLNGQWAFLCPSCRDPNRRFYYDDTRASAPKNPHNRLVRIGEPPTDRWECYYCKATGPYLFLESFGCSYTYPRCVHCGQTPVCAKDCVGIKKALNDENVHVIQPEPTYYDVAKRCSTLDLGTNNAEE